MALAPQTRPQLLASVVFLVTPWGVPLVKQLGQVTRRGVPNTAPYFKLPAGRDEPGEDAVAVAAREANEEVGAVFDPSVLNSVFSEEKTDTRGKKYTRELFIGRIRRDKDIRVWPPEQGLLRIFRPFRNLDAFIGEEDFLPDHRVLLSRPEVKKAIDEMLKT